MYQELISIEETAKMLHIAVKTVRDWVYKRKVSSTKIHGVRRLYKAEIIDLIKKGHLNRVE